MKKITSQIEFEDIRKSGKGLIYNDFSGPRGSRAKDYNVLHRAGCTQVKRMTLSVPKYYGETLDEAVAWLQQNRGREAVRWKRCGYCLRPSSKPAAAPTTKIHRQPQPASPFTESQVEKLLIRWFRERGYQVKTQVPVPSGIIDIVVIGREAEWVIEVKGEDRGGYDSALMNFQIGIGQLVSRMTDPDKQYALAIPVTVDYRDVVLKYRGSIGAEKLGIYFLTVDRTGKVERFAGEQLAEVGEFMNQTFGGG